MCEDYAKEICGWKYDEEYSIYNLSDWNVVVENDWDLAIKERRESDFIAILLENQLIAYGRITKVKEKVFIGIGLKPSLCGKGFGKNVMKLLIRECNNKFPECLVALEVRSFNKRAIRCYESIGFKIKNKYIKDTFTGMLNSIIWNIIQFNKLYKYKLIY
ncbi:GNAT family N-acetyltransferase [Clostridium sporogenes]|uniref:GNAT family N-acetyltransferase n=1 Tax=Clostridium sporogenes TaxID=1509 RepID=UPI00313CE19F